MSTAIPTSSNGGDRRDACDTEVSHSASRQHGQCAMPAAIRHHSTILACSAVSISGPIACWNSPISSHAHFAVMSAVALAVIPEGADPDDAGQGVLLHGVRAKPPIAACQWQPCRQELIAALHAAPMSSMVHAVLSAKRLTANQHSSQLLHMLIVAMPMMVFICIVLAGAFLARASSL